VHNIYPELTGWKVILALDGVELPIPVDVLDYDTCGEDFKKRVLRLANNARTSNDWRPYYRLQESFCDIRPLGALTCHKTQGSTFDNIFLDFRDIYKNRILAEADRAFYVALTRARYNVYILM
jgi:exodeoxyribonuclease-5